MVSDYVRTQIPRIPTEQETRHIRRKSVFVIRDNAGTLEVANCAAGSSTFQTLPDTTAAFSLPLYSNSNGNESQFFTLTSNSKMAGQALAGYTTGFGETRFSGQSTAAIKISDSTAPLGQHSLTIQYNGVNIDEPNQPVYCLVQTLELSGTQECGEAPAASELIQQLQTRSSSGLGLLFLTEQNGNLKSALARDSGSVKLISQSEALGNLTTTADNLQLILSADLDSASAYVSGSSSSPAATGSYSTTLTLP